MMMIHYLRSLKPKALKISLTGASGHVGANLIGELISAGHEIKVLTYRDERALEGFKLEKIKGDLLDAASIDELVKGSEIVIHLAAQISITGDPDGRVFRINTEGVRNVCQACLKHKVRRLIHFSSIHAFDARPFDGILDENRKRVGEKAFRYDYSKACGEDVVRSFVKEGLDAVILNPTSVIGPLDFKPSLMGQVFVKLHDRTLPALVKGGYDFVDVRDVAHAAILAIEKGRTGENYLISGSWKTIRELAELVHQITGSKPPAFTTPQWLAIMGLPFIRLAAAISGKHALYTCESLDVLANAHRNISNEKAKRELGFQPRPLEETIRDLYTWFSENKYLKRK
jgi:dihydroflavonol-4-reductase